MNYHFDFLNDQVNDHINSLINDSNFDINRFEHWINQNHIKDKTNPNTYVKKVFASELEKGTFTPVKEIISIEPLLMGLRSHKVHIIQEDTTYLDVLVTYLISNKLFTIKELNITLYKIIEHNDFYSSREFIKALKSSKAIKDLPIDWDFIESTYKERIEEWNNLFK